MPHLRLVLSGLLAGALVVSFGIATVPSARATAQPPGPPTPPDQPPIQPQSAERIGDNLFRIGSMTVDTAARRVQVPATVNDVALGGPLEFLANTRNPQPDQPGWRAYESAIEAQTDAVSFNLAMVLIGLDNTEAVATGIFDFEVADRVEVWVSWEQDGAERRVRGEELLFNRDTETTLARSHWSYAGSQMDGQGRYRADHEGVLIGFIHRAGPVIEYPLEEGMGRYGHVVFNPDLGLEPGNEVILTIAAIDAEGAP